MVDRRITDDEEAAAGSHPAGWARCRRWLVLLLFLGAFAELCCFALIHGFVARRHPILFRLDYDRLLATITDEHVESARRRSWDPELGWDLALDERRSYDDGRGGTWSYTTDDQRGRVTPFPSARVLISSFGESFTFGDEVDDDETWQFVLSGLTSSRVLNFGVGGYGMDQAYLKAKRKIEAGLRTPIVILGIQTTDIARSLNAYRSLLQPRDVAGLDFKPLFADDGGGYRLVPNPLDRLAGREDVMAAFERAREHDFWYRNRILRDEFPYVLDAARLLLIVTGLRPNPRYDQWGNPDARRRLELAIESFEREVAARGLTPLICVIPSYRDIQDRLAGRRPASDDFFDALEIRCAGRGTIVVHVGRATFDAARFYRGEFGHASAYGNQVIAHVLAERIAPVLADDTDGQAAAAPEIGGAGR